jgi:hypothetical protein
VGQEVILQAEAFCKEKTESTIPEAESKRGISIMPSSCSQIPYGEVREANWPKAASAFPTLCTSEPPGQLFNFTNP